MKSKNNKYAKRRLIAKYIIAILSIIGFPMAMYGTGGDFGEFRPVYYIIGLVLFGIAGLLLWAITPIDNE